MKDRFLEYPWADTTTQHLNFKILNTVYGDITRHSSCSYSVEEVGKHLDRMVNRTS